MEYRQIDVRSEVEPFEFLPGGVPFALKESQKHAWVQTWIFSSCGPDESAKRKHLFVEKDRIQKVARFIASGQSVDFVDRKIHRMQYPAKVFERDGFKKTPDRALCSVDQKAVACILYACRDEAGLGNQGFGCKIVVFEDLDVSGIRVGHCLLGVVEKIQIMADP